MILTPIVAIQGVMTVLARLEDHCKPLIPFERFVETLRLSSAVAREDGSFKGDGVAAAWV